MSPLIRSNFHELSIIAKNRSAARLIILHSDDSLIKAIKEISYNLIYSNIVDLKKSERYQLKKHINILARISDEKNLKKLKLILLKHLTILPLVLKPALRYLGSLVGDV